MDEYNPRSMLWWGKELLEHEVSRATGGRGQYRMTPERTGLGLSSLVYVQFMFVLFLQFMFILSISA